jgi:hypothetical protein
MARTKKSEEEVEEVEPEAEATEVEAEPVFDAEGVQQTFEITPEEQGFGLGPKEFAPEDIELHDVVGTPTYPVGQLQASTGFDQVVVEGKVYNREVIEAALAAQDHVDEPPPEVIEE